MVTIPNFNVPLMDFTPLSQLGQTLGRGIRDRQEFKREQEKVNSLESGLLGELDRLQQNMMPLGPLGQGQVPQPQSNMTPLSELGRLPAVQRDVLPPVAAAPASSSYNANVMRAESGGDPFARNPNSSAAGLYQITDDTWSGLMRNYPDIGLTPDGRFDRDQQERAMNALSRENAQALQRGGIQPTGGNLYAAHFLGAPTAPRVLQAPDDTPMSQLVSRQAMEANPFLKGMTARQFRQWADRKGGGGDTAALSTAQPASGKREAPQQIAQAPTVNPQVIRDLVRGGEIGQKLATQMVMEQRNGNMDIKALGSRLVAFDKRTGQVRVLYDGGGETDLPASVREFQFAQQNPEYDRWRQNNRRDSAMETRINLMTQNGVPQNVATAIATGQIVADRHPVSGEVQIVDKATSRVLYGGQQARQIDDLIQSAGAGEARLYDQVGAATGAYNTARSGLTDTIGQVPGLGRLFTFTDTVEARQGFSTAVGDLVRALSVNPRYPVDEMRRIRSDIGISPGMFTSAEGLRARMRATDRYLRTRLENEHRAANDPTLPRETRQAAAQAANDIGNFLQQMGVPQDGTTPQPQPVQAGGQPPTAAANMLRGDPSPEAQREFDEVFGQGAAARVLGGSR